MKVAKCTHTHTLTRCQENARNVYSVGAAESVLAAMKATNYYSWILAANTHSVYDYCITSVVWMYYFALMYLCTSSSLGGYFFLHANVYFKHTYG